MIRDALAELHQSKHVDVVVRVSVRHSQRYPVSSKNLQLMKVLDVTSFKEVGTTVNDTVRRFLLLDCGSDSYSDVDRSIGKSQLKWLECVSGRTSTKN